MSDPVQRLLERVVIDPRSGCWVYTGQVTDRGYGSVGVKKADGRWSDQLAHGLLWRRCVGEVPKGFQLDHICRCRRCVNPDHLRIVTPRTNTLLSESPAAKNALKTHCLRGHPLTGSNLMLTKDGRRQCRACKEYRRNASW